jgi:hypothetical protein
MISPFRLLKAYTVIFFGRNLFEMGESAQLRFALKNFGRNSPNLGEFRPLLSQRICWFGEISPKSKEIRPKFLGRNLNARVRPFRARKKITVYFCSFSSSHNSSSKRPIFTYLDSLEKPRYVDTHTHIPYVASKKELSIRFSIVSCSFNWINTLN